MTVLEGRGALSSAFSTAWCKHRESIHTRWSQRERDRAPRVDEEGAAPSFHYHHLCPLNLAQVRLKKQGEIMTTTTATYKIAVIPGDGIGKEVMIPGLKVLEACASKYHFELQLEHFDFASCDYYDKHGKMLPDDWVAVLKPFDAIYFGAVGDPKVSL